MAHGARPHDLGQSCEIGRDFRPLQLHLEVDMNDFEFYLPTRVLFGRGTLAS
jgi:hypothetical protein